MENYIKNKRLVANTIILYGRMIFCMIIGLYTSRVVLEALGIVDFGLYNVVGGIIGMFMFLNSSLSTSIQRFLSFNIGKGDEMMLRKVFGTSFILHLLLGILILICAETIGLWFINNHLNYPIDRDLAVNYVFQFTIFTAIVTVLQIPFMALIISREKFSYFAYVSMIEAILKLMLILSLPYFSADKLVLYSSFIFIVSIAIALFYITYCWLKFKESHCLSADKLIIKELLGFFGLFTLSPFAWMTIRQGLNILLNIFYGPVVNASRAISSQIDNVVSGVVLNLRTAINPQIVKSYASGDFETAKKISFEGAKLSFFLLSILSLPIILEIRFILNIWLVEVPEYTAVFCQLVLINSLLQNFDSSFDILFQATGKMKYNYILTNIVYLTTLPLSYLFLKSGTYPATIVFFIQIATTLVAGFCIKSVLLHKILGIPMSYYYASFLKPILKILLVVLPVVLLVYNILPEMAVRFIVVLLVSSCMHVVCIYLWGIPESYKIVVKNKMYYLLTRFKR